MCLFWSRTVFNNLYGLLSDLCRYYLIYNFISMWSFFFVCINNVRHWHEQYLILVCHACQYFKLLLSKLFWILGWLGNGNFRMGFCSLRLRIITLKHQACNGFWLDVLIARNDSPMRCINLNLKHWHVWDV